MSTDRCFEELLIWQTAVELGVRVYALTDDASGGMNEELRKQLRRTVLSISNLIAEGCERGSTNELLRCLGMARGHAGAVRSMLRFVDRLDNQSRDEAAATSAAERLRASEVAAVRALAESCTKQLLDWIDSLRHPDISHTAKPERITTHTVFIPSEHARAFIAKLQMFRAGANARDVFGAN